MSNITVNIAEKDGKLQAFLPHSIPFAKAQQLADATLTPVPRSIDTSGYQWANWGDDDRWPTTMRCKLLKVPMAGEAIRRKVAMMYGNGLAYYRNTDLEGDEVKIRRAYEPGIENWLRTNRIPHKWLIPQMSNYSIFINCFSEYILNQRGDAIVGLYHKEAEFCRLSRQNPRTLNIDYLLFSADFATGEANKNSGRVKFIPLLPWMDEAAFFERLRGSRFAYHSRFETPGIIYYAQPWWKGLFRENGWLDVSIGVPEVVNAMTHNQIRLKYQILIPESYFEIRYPDWSSFDAERRRELINKYVEALNTSLQSSESNYASITTIFRQDTYGKEMGKVEIIAIDDKVKKDSWVPSSQTADAQIVQGLGIHPSQVGLQPEGGKMGAGSGSDQRESFNTQININTIDQDIVLEPLNFLARYNARAGVMDGPVVRPEWDVTFFIDHTFHTTTNLQESGMMPSDTSIVVE